MGMTHYCQLKFSGGTNRLRKEERVLKTRNALTVLQHQEQKRMLSVLDTNRRLNVRTLVEEVKMVRIITEDFQMYHDNALSHT